MTVETGAAMATDWLSFYDRLRSLAVKASPGPWKAEPPNRGITGVVGRLLVPGDQFGDWFHFTHGPNAHRDAAYIAAVDPTTVLVLLDEINRLMAAADHCDLGAHIVSKEIRLPVAQP